MELLLTFNVIYSVTGTVTDKPSDSALFKTDTNRRAKPGIVPFIEERKTASPRAIKGIQMSW